MGADKSEQGGISFRARLVWFGLILIFIVAVPALVVEVPRPWLVLDEMIGRGNALLSGLQAGFDSTELSRMSKFALKVAEETKAQDEDYLSWSFNLLLEHEGLLPEEEMKRALAAAESERGDFKYAEVKAALAFWQERFKENPGLLELFKKYKAMLRKAREKALATGFNYKDAYVMVDDGKTFAFLIDGSEWTESTYPGLKYDVVKHGDEYWRAYLTQGPGFDHNPKFYHLGLFPKFDTDKWGTWFTVWLAEKREGVFHVFSMDFEASGVKRMMWTVAGVILTLLLVVILALAVVTQRLTHLLSEPIDNLIAGTEAIMRMDYDHVVPLPPSREFQRPIQTFNQMIRMLKERVNLMQTIEKLLSKELAEQVAKHGLVLGGQRVDITNIFTDFAGFSTISQKLSPEETVNILNEYFTRLVPIIKKWGGLPDKFIGDAIVAIFGAPVYFEEHAEHAVRAAIEMQKVMREMNEQRRREGKLVLEMRIGLNSGEVIAGAIGSDLKLEYTTIGETTNLANRMEGMCEIGHLLLAPATYEKVKHVFFQGVNLALSPQYVQVKGYSEPIPAYPLYVANLRITKNENFEDPRDYYQTEAVDHQVERRFEDLPSDLQKRFTKVVET